MHCLVQGGCAAPCMLLAFVSLDSITHTKCPMLCLPVPPACVDSGEKCAYAQDCVLSSATFLTLRKEPLDWALLVQAEFDCVVCVLQVAVQNPGAGVICRFHSAGAFSFGTSQRSQILNVRF